MSLAAAIRRRRRRPVPAIALRPVHHHAPITPPTLPDERPDDIPTTDNPTPQASERLTAMFELMDRCPDDGYSNSPLPYHYGS